MKTSARFFTIKSLIMVGVLASLVGAIFLKFAPIDVEKNRAENKMENKVENKISDVNFEEVSENSYVSFKCSPESDDSNFEGLLINAPKIVTYVPGYSNPINGTWARFIICGYYSFKKSTLNLNGDFADAITLIAIDEKTKKRYQGRMGTEAEISENPEDDNGLAAKDSLEDIIGGYFNPNLTYIMGLPEQEADYIVYAQLENFESNRVKISIKKSDQ